MIMRHARMLIDYKGEYIGIREMRKHAAWYTAGFKGASKLRGRLNEAEDINSLEEIVMSADFQRIVPGKTQKMVAIQPKLLYNTIR